MDFETVEAREHSRSMNIPTDPRHLKMLVGKLFQPFDLILLMGLSCTGKSKILNAYDGPANKSVTKWNRDNIWDMMFTDGRRVDKFYNYIDRFEEEVIPKLLIRDSHQVIIEGWNRLPSRRRHYINMMPGGPETGRCGVFVFDGPIDSIVKRNKREQRLDMSDADMKLHLEEKHESLVWPSFDEGWNSILYLNDFGDKGVEYLKPRLVKA